MLAATPGTSSDDGSQSLTTACLVPSRVGAAARKRSQTAEHAADQRRAGGGDERRPDEELAPRLGLCGREAVRASAVTTSRGCGVEQRLGGGDRVQLREVVFGRRRRRRPLERLAAPRVVASLLAAAEALAGRGAANPSTTTAPRAKPIADSTFHSLVARRSRSRRARSRAAWRSRRSSAVRRRGRWRRAPSRARPTQRTVGHLAGPRASGPQ